MLYYVLICQNIHVMLEWNHRMAWIETDLKGHLVPHTHTPAMGWEALGTSWYILGNEPELQKVRNNKNSALHNLVFSSTLFTLVSCLDTLRNRNTKS